MTAKPQDDRYSDEESIRRMNEALKNALRTPHKPHAPLKKAAPKKRPKKAG
jgi:hypothetical protein